MTRSPSKRSRTESFREVVGQGPTHSDLVDKAILRHYELVRVMQARDGSWAEYECNIYDGDTLLSTQKMRHNDYASAAVWAITEFVKVVRNDDHSS